MSDSDIPDPTTPPEGSPPPPPPTGESEATPTEQVPTTDMPPTTQMPATAAAGAAGVAAAGAAAGSDLPPIPPTGPPPPGGIEGEAAAAVPWYKRPGPLAAAILVALLLIALGAWLIWGGGDDGDDAAPTDNQLIIETKDETGSSINRSFIGTLEGPAGSEAEAYLWLAPSNAPPGPVGGATGSSGDLEFSWKPSEAVAEPTTWTSKITLQEEVPADWTPPGPIVDCVLERDGEQESAVSMSVAVDPPDPTVARTATYAFPNFTFVAGDKVTCSLVSTTPTSTTTTSTTTTSTTSTTTTTVPETTTTAAETTTTAAETTTTEATTTTTIPTPATVWDALALVDETQGFRTLITDAGLESDFQDGTDDMTVFAPDNDAIAAGVPAGATQAELAEIVSNLVVTGPAMTWDQIMALTDITADGGDTYAVDSGADTVGGAGLTSPGTLQDLPGGEGLIQVLDDMPVAN